MDYHSLPRKQLQALCKKHDIPANQTNVQMADALTTLLKAEGKPKSDANAGKMQSVRVESGREKSVLTTSSNVPKATRSNKDAVKSTEQEGCEEHVASVEDVESNEGAKIVKTRARGLPKLVPESKEHEDEIDGTARKHCRGTQRERTCKNSDSDLSIVDVTSKKMDNKKKTSASGMKDEVVDEKARENIEGHQGLKVEETLQVQENDGKHLRQPKKKTMPEEQTKPKVVDVGTKRTRAGKHPAVATESSVKDVEREEEDRTNKFEPSCENRGKKAQETGKLPVIIDIVDSDDEEVVKDWAKNKDDIVDVSVEPTVNPSESLKPVVTVNGSESPKQVVTRKGRRGGHKKEEVLKTSTEQVKINAACVSVEPTSNSSECLKQVVTLRGQKCSHKEEKVVTASSEEDKVDVADEPAVNQRGRKGGKKEELILSNSIEEANNIVTDVPVEATANASESPKQVVTCKGRKGEHKKEVLKASSEVDKVNAVCVSVEPTLNSLKCLKQVVTRRGQKCSHKEEKVVNASSKEDKVDVSDEPVVNQRGQKGGKKEELIVIDSVEEAKNIVTDVPVEATVNASESPKRVVTRKGRKDEHKKEVLKTGSEEDKVNEVCVSVEPTSSSLECLKQVVTRRGQKCSHKEEKVVNDSSEEDKVDVSDEPAVNQRGQKGGKKEELIVTDVPVEAAVNASESPKRVVTRKGRKDEHKKVVLKTGSEENKVNEVCVSVEPTSSSLECLKQVVTRRGQKCSHKEEKVVNARSEEDKVDVSDEPAVNRRGRKGGQKKELIVTNSAEEAKIIGTDVPVEVTVNASKSSKRVVTRKGCKSDHKKGEVLKADSEEDKVNADCVSVELTLNSSECLKQIVAQRGEKCSQELLVTDSSEEAKNNTTDISVGDNVNASESPKRLVTRRRCKVLDASAKESKVDPVSIPVKLTVNSSETPKHVVTRRGRANTQEGRNVVTVNASECLKQVVTRRGEKCSQKESLVTDSIEEAKKTSDISVEDNMNASESPKRVDTRQRCKVGHEKVMNASAKESKVDPVNIPVKFTRNCSETPKHVVTRRGRFNRQEEVLETNIVEEAKNNVTNSPVEASVNFEDDASVEVSGNPSSKHVTHKGRKSWFKEELVNASSEENKVDAIGMSVESIEGQGESSSEVDESDGKEKKADFRNLNDKNYGSKIKTKRTQQRQKPGKNLQGDKGNIKEEDKSDEKQKQSSSDTHRGLQKKTIHAKPDIRKSSQQEDLVQTEGHIDAALPSSTSGSYCLHEAEGGEIVQEIIDRDNQPSSTEVVEMKENKDSHRNLQRKANAPRSQTRRSQTIQGPMKNEGKKSSHQNTFPDNHQKNVNLNALEEVVEENMEGQDSDFMVHVEYSPEKERLHEHQVPVMLEALHTKSGADYAKIDNLEALLDNVPDIPDENIEVEQSEEEKIVFIKEEAGSLVDQSFKVLLVESEFISNDDIQDEQALNRTNNVVCQIVNEENGNDMAQGGHFEMKSGKFHFSPYFTANTKDFSENKKILAGKNLMVGNTGFDVDNLNESLESIKEKPNKPHDDSVNDQEDEENSENKSEEVYSSSDLAAKDDEALEEQTVAGDGMIAGSTVFVDNILDKSLESLEKDSILPCEVGIDSAVNEEDANELRDSSNCEDGNFNDVKEKELYLIRDLEISPQKASYNEAEESGECHTGETSAVNDNLQDHLSYVIEEANLSGTPVKKLEHTSSSNLFSCSSNCEEDNFNDVKEKELYLIRDLEISPQKASNNEAEESGECHNGETSVVNEGLQDHLSYVIEEASLSGTPVKKLEHTSSSNISSCSGMNDSAVEEERRETLPTDPCKENLYESDTSLKISELIKGHKELCTPLKKAEFTSSTNVSPWLGMDDFVAEERVELPELDTQPEMPEFTKGHLPPHVNSLFGEDTPLKKTGLTGMDDSASEWSQEVHVKEDCKLKVPEMDSPSKTLELQKCHGESLFMDTLFGEGTPLKKCELTNTNAASHSGMDDSAIGQSEVTPSTEACKIELSESDAPSKIFDCTKDNDFSFSPCLNIFDTPLKKPVLQSSTGRSICSGMDDFGAEHNQEVHSTEACKLVCSETFTPSKIPELAKDNERTCLDTLFVEDISTFLKKPELASITNMSHISGMGDSDMEQSRKILPQEASKNELSQIDDSSVEKTLSVKDIGTSLKIVRLDRDLQDSVILEVQEVLPTEASKNELSQIDDSSVEKSGGIFSTETCKLEAEPLELNSPSKMPELTEDHDRSPSLNTLFVDKSAATLKNFEHTNSTGMSPCGIDDSAVEQSRDVLPAEACKLELSELNAPSEMPELSIDGDRSPCLKNLSVEINDTSLKTPKFTRGVNDSAAEPSGDVLSTEVCKLDLSKLSTPSKMAEVTEDHDISPCLETLFVDDMPLFSEMDDSTVDQDVGVLPTEACKLELSELDTSSKMPEVTEDQDRSPCLNTLFLEDIGVNDSAAEQSGDVLSTEVCKLDLSKLSTPSKMAEVTEDRDISPCLETLFVDDMPLFSEMDDSTVDQNVDVLPTEGCNLELSELDTLSKMPEVTEDQDRSPCLNTLFLEDIGVNDSAAEPSGDVLSTEICKLDLPKLSTPSKMAEVTEDHDISPCLETLFVDDMPLFSEMDDSTVDQNMDVLPTEACKLELSELDSSSKMSEVTKDQDRSPCFNTLFLEDIGNLLKKTELTSTTHVQCCSVMNDSVLEQNQAVLALEVCKQKYNEFDNPLKMSEFAKDHSLSPCLNMLAEDFGDISPCSGINDSAAEQSGGVLSPENCKLDLSKLSTPSKMVELTEDYDRSPCLETLFVDDMPLLSEMNDSTVDQKADVLPTEACKLELSELDTSSKMPEVTRDQDRSPCLNTLFPEDIGNLLKKTEHTSSAHIECCSVMNDSVLEQSQAVLPLDKHKQECYEFDNPLKVSELTKDHSLSPCLNMLAEDSGDISPSSGINGSAAEQSGYVLSPETCKLDLSKLSTPSKMAELSEDHDISPCLETLFVDDMSLLSGMEDSTIEQSVDVLPTEACKREISELDTLSKMPEVTKDQDRSPCLNTLFLEDIGNLLKKTASSTHVQCCSIMNDSVLEQSQPVLPLEVCKQECYEFDNSLKVSELTKDHSLSPCLNMLAEDSGDISRCSGINDSAAEQSGDALSTETCKLDLSKLSTPSKMAELTDEHDISSCFETLFVDDMPLLSEMEDSTVDQSMDVLPTEACKREISELDTTSKMPEVTKDQDRSPCLNTLFPEDTGNLLKKTELTSSTHVQCCSVMNDSVLEHSQAVLPLEVCKQECYEFDNPLKVSELTEGHSLSPCLNMLAGDFSDISPCSGINDSAAERSEDVLSTETCKLDLSKLSTPSKMAEITEEHDISPCLETLFVDDMPLLSDMDDSTVDQSVDVLPTEACKRELSDGADSGLHKTLEIHRTEDSNHELSRMYTPVMRQSSSTPSEGPKLADIDDLLMIDDYAPEQNSEILPTEASKLQCGQLDTRLKMGDPSEGHDNPGFQSRPAVESDLTKLSLRQLRRLYKEKQIKQKESGKVIGKHPVSQDLSSNVYAEESSSVRNPEQSQQDCMTDLQCNIEVSRINTSLNEPEIAEGSEKLDKPEEFSTGSNYVVHQTSPAGIRLPEMTNSYKVSPCSGINASVLEQNQQACQTDLCFNNQPSQVNTPLNKPEATEAYAKLHSDEDYDTESNGVLHQTSVAGVRLQEHTPLIKPELAEGCNRPAQPEQYSTSLKNSECTDHDLLCQSPAAGIMTSETVFADESKAFEEEPFLPNNSVESGLFVEEYNVCKMTATSSKVESRIPTLADRLQILRDRLQTIQSNLQGQTPELSYATPLRKGINRKSIGSAKRSRVPMSVGRSNLAFEGDKLASTKENPIDRTHLSLKRDQISYKENQIKSKDSEKVVGKRPALKNLSLNVLEQRVDFVGQSDKRLFHIHEEDCS